MSRPEWTLNLLKLGFPRDPAKGSSIANLPVVRDVIERLLFDGDQLICLPRDKTVQVDKPIKDSPQTVLPSELCDRFIDKMDYHVIMNFCICRLSMGCKDYPIDYGCIFMGEAARGINPKWGRSVSKDEAKQHIRKSQESGLVHFVGKSKLDTVWLGIGPGEKLLTICNCCPCCCITRGIPYMPENLAGHLHKAPGVELSVDEELCTGCGTCMGECFAHSIKLSGGMCVITEDCRGCGRCVSACPEEAITLTIDGERFERESLNRISAVVDIPG